MYVEKNSIQEIMFFLILLFIIGSGNTYRKSTPKVHQPERLLLVYFFLNPIFTKTRKPLPHKGLRHFRETKKQVKKPAFLV